MSTALVPIALNEPSPDRSTCRSRPRADFLAQLIATAAQAPQTRTRRRAEPAEAAAVYSAIEGRAAAQPPALRRSL